jgi:hypothetical protein
MTLLEDRAGKRHCTAGAHREPLPPSHAKTARWTRFCLNWIQHDACQDGGPALSRSSWPPTVSRPSPPMRSRSRGSVWICERSSNHSLRSSTRGCRRPARRRGSGRARGGRAGASGRLSAVVPDVDAHKVAAPDDRHRHVREDVTSVPNARSSRDPPTDRGTRRYRLPRSLGRQRRRVPLPRRSLLAPPEDPRRTVGLTGGGHRRRDRAVTQRVRSPSQYVRSWDVGFSWDVRSSHWVEALNACQDGLAIAWDRFPIGWGIGVIEEHSSLFGTTTSENLPLVLGVERDDG